MTEIIIYNVQRAVTANVGKQELWFLCFTCYLMVVHISVKFMKYLPQLSSYQADMSI